MNSWWCIWWFFLVACPYNLAIIRLPFSVIGTVLMGMEVAVVELKLNIVWLSVTNRRPLWILTDLIVHARKYVLLTVQLTCLNITLPIYRPTLYHKLCIYYHRIGYCWNYTAPAVLHQPPYWAKEKYPFHVRLLPPPLTLFRDDSHQYSHCIYFRPRYLR